MNIPDKNQRNRTSLWQLEKMKTIIEDRWEEVWEIVTTRDCSLKSFVVHDPAVPRERDR